MKKVLKQKKFENVVKPGASRPGPPHQGHGLHTPTGPNQRALGHHAVKLARASILDFCMSTGLHPSSGVARG